MIVVLISCYLKGAFANEATTGLLGSNLNLHNSSLNNQEVKMFEQFWLDVTLNHQHNLRTVLIIKDQKNNIFIAEPDLVALQLKIPQQYVVDDFSEKFYALKDLNIQYSYDLKTMTLELQAPVDVFKHHDFKLYEEKILPLSESGSGAFFNYDFGVSYSHSDQKNRGSGFFEMAMFNRWGSGASTFLGKFNPMAGEKSWLRLDSFWRKDFPDALTTLIVGDTSTKGTAWGGGVRFAGLQWGSNFTTRPNFVTLPLTSMSGEAVLPSTVELYINDALRFQQEVTPGTFLVDAIPTVTGKGEIKLKVKDILNREQIIQQSFYGNQKLLRVGLNEYAIEVGKIRENYGLNHADYGQILATTTWRNGVTPYLTLETHAQILKHQKMMGVGLYSLLPLQSLLSVVVANSHAKQQGQFYSIGLQHQGERFSWGGETQFTTENFIRLGMLEGQDIVLKQQNIYMSTTGFGPGSLNLNYYHQKYNQGTNLEFVGANYGFQIFNRAYIQFAAIHFLNKDQTNITASLSFSSEGRKNTSISVGQIDKRIQSQLQIQKNLPQGEGFGYRLSTMTSEAQYNEIGLSFQNNYFTSQVEMAQVGNQLQARGRAKGGVAVMAGDWFASRSIDQSFAVVRVPEFSNVRVYLENQEIAKTNKKGLALVSQLRAYEKNNIQLQQADLPLDVKIKELSMNISPYYRSGVLLDFPVTASRQVLLRVLDDRGQALPLGAVVENIQHEFFPIGKRGEVFLSDLDEENTLVARWQEKSCSFQLKFSDLKNEGASLPEVICHAHLEPLR